MTENTAQTSMTTDHDIEADIALVRRLSGTVEADTPDYYRALNRVVDALVTTRAQVSRVTAVLDSENSVTIQNDFDHGARYVSKKVRRAVEGKA